MRLPATRSLLLLCLFCLFGGASVALAASVHRSRERPSHTAQACRRHRAKHHRHCPAARAGKKSHRKHGRGSGAKPSSPKGVSKGAGSPATSAGPWTGAPAPVIPGAGSESGPSPGSPAGGGAAPTETPSAPAGPVHVQVTAEDTSGYHFILSRTSVPAGEVVIEFVNHGQDEHNLHAVEQPAEKTEAGGLKENVKPDAHTDLTLNLHTGSYTLFCSLPGHEAKGMKATLKVE